MLVRIGTRLVLLLGALCTVGCDRVTKHLATTALAGEPTQSFFGDLVRLTYAENPGGFLSFGAGLPPAARTALFTIATGAVLAGLIALALRGRWTSWQSVGFALFIGGGISNWLDRALQGRVVDFLNVGIGGLRTGIFNVADVALLAGVGILLFAELSRARASR